MPTFTATKTIDLGHSMTESVIHEKFKKALEIEFNELKVRSEEGAVNFEGELKQGWGSVPVVGSLAVRMHGTSLSLLLDADMKSNSSWTWLMAVGAGILSFVLTGSLGLAMALGGGILVLSLAHRPSNMRRSLEAMQRVLQRLEFEVRTPGG